MSTIVSKDLDSKSVTNGIDKILLHPILGYLIFFGVLFLIFQGIYNWSGPAMDFIDTQFADLAAYVQSTVPAGPLPDLLSNGIIKGIGGIVIFVPQIVILYIFISLMEETGYMSRVVFLWIVG
ncbi:hypothetical protein OKW96_14055 [Sphingobacterium sp. KU25419]|nr:hypothetical protein OKW96_14055 [Sphingobacterium sp. KU25419]